MSVPTRQELLQRFGKVDDPEIEARRQHILDFLLESSPQKKQQLTEQAVSEARLETRLTDACSALRRVFLRRQLTPSRDDDARIEACTEHATLVRWLDQAVTAVSVSAALE